MFFLVLINTYVGMGDSHAATATSAQLPARLAEVQQGLRVAVLPKLAATYLTVSSILDCWQR